MNRTSKCFLLISSALLIAPLSACSQNNVIDNERLSSLLFNNKKQELWKRHHNFAIDFKQYENDQVIETLQFYVDKDYAQWDFSYGDKWIDGHSITLDSYLDNNEQYYVAYLSSDDAYHEENLKWAKDNEFLEQIEIDKVIEAKEDKNNIFNAYIEYNEADKVKQVIKNNTPDLPDGLTYEEGMAIRYRYAFNSATEDLISYITYLVKKGQEPLLVNKTAYTYDVETYDPFKDGEPFANYQKMMNDSTQLRKIAIVFDVDTENEFSRIYDVPKYADFRIIHNGERVYNFYLDRACTTLYERERNADELILYVPVAK